MVSFMEIIVLLMLGWLLILTFVTATVFFKLWLLEKVFKEVITRVSKTQAGPEFVMTPSGPMPVSDVEEPEEKNDKKKTSVVSDKVAYVG